MSSLIKYDVVIAGAGPAGCAAAIRLKQMNLKVCLIDDRDASRLKVGESLPGAAIRLLATLGIEDLEKLMPRKNYIESKANISAWGKEGWEHSDAISNPEGGGWHIQRNVFDAALLKYAKEKGVHHYKGKIGRIKKVTKSNKETCLIEFKTKKETLPDQLISKWVIDGTGRSSAVLKQFEIERVEYGEQWAVICWMKSSKEDVDTSTRIKSVKNGWWYTSKLPDNSRVVVFHGLSDSAAYLVRNPNEFIRQINKIGLISYQVSIGDMLQEVSVKRAGVSKPTQVIDANWLAIGDAALSFDPISSQGIFFALYSGIRGAETIACILNSEEKTLRYLQDYSKKIHKVFTSNERSRKYFYTQEVRYQEDPYWQQYLQPIYDK